MDSEDSDDKYNENEITRFREVKQRNVVQSMKSEKIYLQLTTSSRRQDGGAYCEAAVDGICMRSKGKLHNNPLLLPPCLEGYFTVDQNQPHHYTANA